MELLKPPFSNPARRIQLRLATPKDESEGVSRNQTTGARWRRGTEVTGEVVVGAGVSPLDEVDVEVATYLTPSGRAERQPLRIES